MSTKNTQLDKLFSEWKGKDKSYKGNFVSDGIIDENTYNTIKPKILFITKEPNDPNIGEWDYRRLWNYNYNIFEKRISQWTFGILYNFPEFYDDIFTDKLIAEFLKKIAILNVKKSGGSGNSKDLEICKHIKENLDLIHKEIDIINPDIILLGINEGPCRNAFYPIEKYPNIAWMNRIDTNGNRIGTDFTKIDKRIVINFYHPSAFNLTDEHLYYTLRDIFSSEEYKKLELLINPL